MSDTVDYGYGYVDPESEVGGSGGLDFGLNTGVTISKFEYITNGGKDGAEGEALDIILLVNEKEKGYRRFPVTKAFAKSDSSTEITDPKAPEMVEARKAFNAIMSHIMGCLVAKDVLITALARPFPDFKTYCQVLMGLLPKDFTTIKLDAFAQYQWNIKGTATKTYVEFPQAMKHGIWLVPSIKPVNADGTLSEWKEVRKENPKDSDNKALIYTDGAGNIHPITRNGWFVNSNFATQQKEVDDTASSSNGAMSEGAHAPAASTAGAAGPASGW